MYLPSKIKSKHIAVFLLFALLLILPFKNFVANLFIAFSAKRLIFPGKTSKIINELEKKNLALSLAIQKNQIINEENERLKKALSFKEDKKTDIVGTEIIFFNPSVWRRLVIINAGEDKNLKEGMYAVNADGYLIGRITDVKGKYSRLILIDDPEFTLPVFIGKDSLGMLKGGLDSVKVLYIDARDNVNVNDIIWFKMPFLSYPIYIGRIEKISEDNDGLFFDVDVSLFAKNPILDKIFVLR